MIYVLVEITYSLEHLHILGPPDLQNKMHSNAHKCECQLFVKTTWSKHPMLVTRFGFPWLPHNTREEFQSQDLIAE